MHQLENEKEPVRFDRREVFAVAYNDLGNADLAGTAQRFMQKCIRLLAAFLGFEKIRLVKEFGVDSLQVNEIGDVDRMSGLDANLFEILIAHDDVATALVLEAFDNLVRGNLLHVCFRDLLIFDGTKIGPAQLSKTEFFLARGGINRDRNVNQPKADTAFPN